jgi:hypothetical protein
VPDDDRLRQRGSRGAHGGDHAVGVVRELLEREVQRVQALGRRETGASLVDEQDVPDPADEQCAHRLAEHGPVGPRAAVEVDEERPRPPRRGGRSRLRPQPPVQPRTGHDDQAGLFPDPCRHASEASAHAVRAGLRKRAHGA